MTFEDLRLIDPLVRAVRKEGYSTPTPIQVQAIPYVLDRRDLLGCAQTGTGKTAAFALPILQHLYNELPKGRDGRRQGKDRRGPRPIRALVLTPTRELALQIGENFGAYAHYTHLNYTVIYGGVGQHQQAKAIRSGVDVLVATPGRLLDLMGQGIVRLDEVEFFVLDEADRMLDMGFIHDVRRIVKAIPQQRQTLLFSATMPKSILDLAGDILVDPVHVEVNPESTTVESIAQSVFFVEKENKQALLEHILRDQSVRRVLVFTRTKHGANKVVKKLSRASIDAEAIHGNKSQSARERALRNFKSDKTRVLVATDIASRGLDVEDVTHVINYDLPNEPESYVHRIGRTARAGASGIAFSFCDAKEYEYLLDIEKLIRLRVPVEADHPYVLALPDNVLAKGSNGQKKPAPSRGQAPRAQKSDSKHWLDKVSKDGRRPRRGRGRSQGNNTNSQGRRRTRQGDR